LKKTIRNAFQGAPYEVTASLPKIRSGRSQNIRFQSRIQLGTINGSRACIHDGTDAITQYCIALGIPQIILHDSSYIRQWNAAKLRHAGIGLAIDESELTMERLYETYRILCADDSYFLAAAALRKEAGMDGDLSSLLDYIP
jgi:UDP:flavonoid glycosyltransferase YjiC (YdhE family)